MGSPRGPCEPAGPEDGAVQRRGSWARSSLQLGRSPETPASIGRGCALGTAESLQREASGYGDPDWVAPARVPGAVSVGVPEARSLQGKPFVGQAGRGFGWQVVCGDGEAQEGASERLVGPECLWEGRSVKSRDLWGKPALGVACGGGAWSLRSTVGCGWGAPRDRRVQDHFTCFENPKNRCRVWSPLGTAVPGEAWRDSVGHRSDSPYSSSSGSREPREGLRGGCSPVQRGFLQTADGRGALRLGWHSSCEKPGDR